MQNSKFQLKIKIGKIAFVLTILFFLVKISPVFAAVNISIDSFPSPVTIGQEFSISITANNLSSGTSYYIKGRIGIGSDLDKAETNNPNNSSPDDWLADTDSWSKFPQITAGSDTSTWSGTIKLRAKSTATVGQNSLKVRIKKTTTDTTYDSNAYEINLQAAPTPTATPVPTSVPTSSPTNTPTPSPTPQPQSSPTVRPSATPTKKPGVTPRVYDPDAEAITPRQEPTGTVLGETTNSTTGSAKEAPIKSQGGTSLPLLLLLLGGGFGCIVAAIVMSTRRIRRRRII